MARVLPDVDPESIEYPSEKDVYVALSSFLNHEYIVIHSYPWLRPWRGDNLLEGEADFVIIHPQRGLLVLEVKGGDTIRLNGRTWVRDTKNGPKPFQDPFEQARRNMHALLDIIKEKSGGRISKEMLSFGYAVVFPHMDYTGKLPANVDEKILLCQRHMNNFDASIEVASASWGESKEALSLELYTLLLNECLLPKFRLFRPVGPSIEIESSKILELTETQAQVFEGLYEHTRVLVKGIAGSGKTFLALDRALAFAREGRKTLFICFNKELARWLERLLESDPTHTAYLDNLTIENFHRLTSNLAKKAEIPFKPVGGGKLSQQFWDEEAPDLLEQAVQALEDSDSFERYGAMVVDEGQDFLLGWWYALLNSIIADIDQTPIYVFIDPNQALRNKVEMPPMDFPTSFSLNINCRNTKTIAYTSADLLDLSGKVFKNTPVGFPVRMIRAKTQQQQKGLLMEEVRNLITNEDISTEQLVIIGPASHDAGSLSGLDSIHDYPLVSSAEEWRDGEGILVTTARSFKGLEADVIVLYDLDNFSQLFSAMDLYVACTRARHLLVVLTTDGEVRQLLTQSINSSSEKLTQ